MGQGNYLIRMKCNADNFFAVGATVIAMTESINAGANPLRAVRIPTKAMECELVLVYTDCGATATCSGCKRTLCSDCGMRFIEDLNLDGQQTTVTCEPCLDKTIWDVIRHIQVTAQQEQEHRHLEGSQQ